MAPVRYVVLMLGLIIGIFHATFGDGKSHFKELLRVATLRLTKVEERVVT